MLREEFEELRRLVRKATRAARRLASGDGQPEHLSRNFYFSELILRTAARGLSMQRSEAIGVFRVVAPDMLEEIKEEQPACSVVWVSDEVSDACSRDPLLIGWAYQFWNEAARDLSTWAINRKDEERSAAYSVAAATQLFTEEYMTSFLCEHCVPLARSAVSEGQVDVLDPACGAGHFLVALLRYFNRVDESRSAAQSMSHLFGCDIDSGAVELARAILVLEVGRIDGVIERSVVATLLHNIQMCGATLGTLDRDDACPVLRRRYDCVLTNPPYIGRRKLSKEVRDFLDTHYPATSLDICAAFMQRCVELLNSGGAVGLVTVDKWLRLKGYEPLRTGGQGFEGLYRLLSLDVICELGRRAFSSLAGLHDGVGVVLLSAVLKPPSAQHTFRHLSYASLKDFEKKAEALSNTRLSADEGRSSICIKQEEVLAKGSSRAFLLQGQLPIGLLDQRRLVRDMASVVVGLQTSDDRQFVRHYWEVPPDHARFKVHAKGGGYGRWYGFNRYLIDWGRGESRFRADPKSGIGVEEWFERPGWTYTWFANGALGLRQKDAGWSFGRASASGVFVEDIRLIAFLNSRLGSLAVRAVGGKAQLPEGVMRQLPIPHDLSALDAELVREAVELKKSIVSRDPTEVTFAPGAKLDVIDYWRAQALLLMIEGRLELQSLDAAKACDNERTEISSRLAPPVSWSKRLLNDAESQFWRGTRGSLRNKLLEMPCAHEAKADRQRVKDLVLAGLRGRLSASRTESTLPGMLPLEALCWITQLHPVDVWIALSDMCSEDRGIKRELQSRLLYVHLTECILGVFGHHWWSNSANFKGLRVSECSLDELVQGVLESSCHALEEELDLPLREWLRHRFLKIHDKMFFQRPLIVKGGAESSFIHRWGLEGAAQLSVVDSRAGWHAFG